jgi:hypothetical protein
MLRIIVIAAVAIGSAVAETTVPKGAAEIEPGVHRHTDSTGQTYIYRKTPFGIVKSLETPKSSEKAESAKGTHTPTPFGPVKNPPPTDYLKATERGDVIEFERSSPFGSYKWKKNKNDLTAVEREAWDRASQISATGPKE